MTTVHAPSIASEKSALALLVDRDDDTRRMYAQFLKLSTWSIEEASDGREALAKAIARQPDVIVTETRLPGINGYDLCGLLRRDTITREIPIVVVTADAYPADLQHAHEAGADIVLVKPCLPERLASEVAKVIDTARSLQARGAIVHERVATQVARARTLVDQARETKRQVLSRAHLRHDTTTPPLQPPILVCPQCDQPLVYKRSHVGGVSARHSEQWDYFECASGCGSFQYRERTRKLRKVL
jgi:two-component system, chemotaxis family, response regulator PixH